MAETKPRPSLHDVARHAGVSPATVSRVLNHRVSVRAEARSRVLASIEALGYEHSPGHTRTIAAQQTIACLITDILNPFFTEIIRGIQDEAEIERFALLLYDTAEDSQHEGQILRRLIERPVDGIIIAGSRLAIPDLLTLRQRRNTPIAVINRHIDASNIRCIVVDFKNATYRATRHLLNLAHSRIAYLASSSSFEVSSSRQQGVETALAEVGLSLKPVWRPASFPNVDGGFQAMSTLLTLPPAGRPTAVIAYNDLMALGALHAIRAAGLHVPEDLSVIGFDDIAMAAHANPPLTTVAQPKYRMGRLAMRLLRQILEEQPTPGEGYVLVESPLIIRESTAPPPSAPMPGEMHSLIDRTLAGSV